MRKPQLQYDKGKEPEQRCNPEGSGTLARMKRFLSLSLGSGRRSPPYVERSCAKFCMKNQPPSSSSTILTNLKAEAEHVFGRPLDELKHTLDEGVPAFVHALCCYILTHGVDYETLVSLDWEGEDIKSSFQEGVFRFSYESLTDATMAAALLRLFLQELPQPLLNKEIAFSLLKIRKEIDKADDVRSELLHKIRSLLFRKVAPNNLNLLRYLAQFLHQLQVANHNKCPVPPVQLERVLALALPQIGKEDSPEISSSQILAEMILLNQATIFREGIRIQPSDYSSDSVSSACETGDDDDAFCPEYDRQLASGVENSITDDIEDDSTTTTTTTDTDDFRSPPVSPLNRPYPLSTSHSPPPYEVQSINKFSSTAEVSDVDNFDNYHADIVPYGKKYFQSITGFVTSAGESWADEKLRRDVDTFDSLVGAQSTESSCISGGDMSEENEGDRDADGSEGEGSVIPPCPHDERRFSERFCPRNHNSSARRPKRKIRRKHSKDAKNRVPSSEEEERSDQLSVLDSLRTHEDQKPNAEDAEQSKVLRDLVESSDPVQSDRSSWCLRRDEQSLSDNCQRTSRHFSREDYDQSIQPINWYRADEREDNYALVGSKYSEQTSTGLSYDFATSPRGGGSQTAIKTLSKHVSSLKRKVKKFEEEFELSFGYRPSHSDKMKYPQIKKQITELSKSKKELKQMKEEMPEKKKSKSYPMSLLRCQESTSQISSSSSSHQSSDGCVEASETLRQVEERLTTKRDDANRPTELTLLSLEQYQDEKTDLQKALLYYESIHGRPVTREDRDRVRPFYDRYRQVKRGIARLSSRSKESIELAPILEHEAMDFTLASPQHRGSIQEDSEQEHKYKETHEEIKLLIPKKTPIEEVAHPTPAPSLATSEINLGDLHALPIHELKDRKREAKEQKKKTRKNLREFEEKFESENGRKMLKEERGPMEHAYTKYKHVKAKLRLLEALISKHDSR